MMVMVKHANNDLSAWKSGGWCWLVLVNNGVTNGEKMIDIAEKRLVTMMVIHICPPNTKKTLDKPKYEQISF